MFFFSFLLLGWMQPVFKLEVWVKNTHTNFCHEGLSIKYVSELSLGLFFCFFFTSGSFFFLIPSNYCISGHLLSLHAGVQNVFPILFLCSFYCLEYPLLSSCQNPINNLPILPMAVANKSVFLTHVQVGWEVSWSKWSTAGQLCFIQPWLGWLYTLHICRALGLLHFCVGAEGEAVDGWSQRFKRARGHLQYLLRPWWGLTQDHFYSQWHSSEQVTQPKVRDGGVHSSNYKITQGFGKREGNQVLLEG